MKPRKFQLLGSFLAFAMTQASHAASGTWTGLGADSLWSNAANWSASPAPSGTDTATFNGAGNGKTTIDTTGNVTAKFITFDTASAASYTIGQQADWRPSDGAVLKVNSTVTTNQNFNPNIRLAVGTTVTFDNDSTSSLLKLRQFQTLNTTNTANAIYDFKPVAGATIEVTGLIDNSGSGNNIVRLSDAGTLKISGEGNYDGGATTAANSVEILQGTLMANKINNASTSSSVRSSLGQNGRVQFGETGQTRTATLDYYNTTSTTTDRVFHIIDNNTAVFKVSGSSSTNLAITSGITQSGSANGGAKLTKDGVGTLTLSGNNAHSGQTIISAGSLVAGHVNALGTAGSYANRTTINTGGTLELATDASVATEVLDILTNNSGAVVVNRATTGVGITHALGTTLLGSNSTLNVTKGANVTSGTATLELAGITLASASDGTGTLNADTAAISVTGGVSAGVAYAKTLGLTGSHTQSAISGAITNGTGNLSLTKDGAGTWTLSNANNSYTGNTAISGGKLVVDGNISTSVLTKVEENGTLAGTGTTGAVTVLNGGTLAPGNSAGTLAVSGALTLNNLSNLNFELNPTANTVGLGVNDLITVTGNFTLDGLLSVAATSGSFASVTSGTWRLFNYNGTLTNNTLTFDSMPSLASGYSWSLDTATSGQVNLTVIPEPRAALLGGIGMLLLLRRRRN